MACLLVTRALPEAKETAAHIITSGHDVLLAPLRCANAVRYSAPARPDALIATSANAFRYGTPIPHDWLDLPVYCVGNRTADMARSAGFSMLHIAEGDVRTLLPMMLATPKTQFLYLAGEPRKPVIETACAQAGVSLGLWLRYKMEDVSDLPLDALKALETNHIDAVLHFSSEAAGVFFDLAMRAGVMAAACSPIHACLSEPVAQHVRTIAAMRAVSDGTNGSVRVVVAQDNNGASLVNAAITACS